MTAKSWAWISIGGPILLSAMLALSSSAVMLELPAQSERFPPADLLTRLAAGESGQQVNYSKISQDCGLSVPTVRNHYRLLEDMFLGFNVLPFTRSVRKKIMSSPKFLLFDVGVRHAAAGLTPSRETVLANPGPIFEQWVGIELWKRIQYLGEGTLSYERTRDGAEVDFIVERKGRCIPFEVKWTERPRGTDARHLATFLREHPREAQEGYLVCRCPTPQRLAKNILALPWNHL